MKARRCPGDHLQESPRAAVCGGVWELSSFRSYWGWAPTACVAKFLLGPISEIHSFVFLESVRLKTLQQSVRTNWISLILCALLKALDDRILSCNCIRHLDFIHFLIPEFHWNLPGVQQFFQPFTQQMTEAVWSFSFQFSLKHQQGNQLLNNDWAKRDQTEKPAENRGYPDGIWLPQA